MEQEIRGERKTFICSSFISQNLVAATETTPFLVLSPFLAMKYIIFFEKGEIEEGNGCGRMKLRGLG